MAQTKNDMMTAIWRATVACCIALEDSGWSVEEVAGEMPGVMKRMADVMLKPAYVYRMAYLLDCGAVSMGRDEARRLVTENSRKRQEAAR